ALAIDASTRIGGVHIARRTRGRRQRQPGSTFSLPRQLKGSAASDGVEPGLERTIRAIVTELAVGAHEDFLGDVFSFVGIAGESQRPPKYGRLKTRHERGERGIIACGCQRRELGIHRVRRAIPIRDRGLRLSCLAMLFPSKTIAAHRQPNIRLNGHEARLRRQATSPLALPGDDATRSTGVYSTASDERADPAPVNRDGCARDVTGSL